MRGELLQLAAACADRPLLCSTWANSMPAPVGVRAAASIDLCKCTTGHAIHPQRLPFKMTPSPSCANFILQPA